MKPLSFLSLALFLPLFSFAADAPPATSTATERRALSLENFEFSYALLLKGANVEHLDGDTNGKGTNLNLRNYQNFAYKLGDGWSADAGSYFRRYWRPADPKNKNRSDFEWRDPYVGASKKDLWRKDSQAVSARVRYYIPATEYNISNRVKEYDEGKGSLQLAAQYSNKFLDELLTFRLPFEYNRRFAAYDHKVREDFWVGARPSLTCKTSRRTNAKLEYYTGDVNHRTNGRWTKLNEPSIGHTAAAGFEWFPVSGLLVSPQITWGREDFRFNAAELSLYASYAFL